MCIPDKISNKDIVFLSLDHHSQHLTVKEVEVNICNSFFGRLKSWGILRFKTGIKDMNFQKKMLFLVSM